jgi:hypothetical protein
MHPELPMMFIPFLVKQPGPVESIIVARPMGTVFEFVSEEVVSVSKPFIRVELRVIME